MWDHTHTHTQSSGRVQVEVMGRIKGDEAFWSASHQTSSSAHLLLLFITALRPPPPSCHTQVSGFPSSSAVLSSPPYFTLSSPARQAGCHLQISLAAPPTPRPSSTSKLLLCRLHHLLLSPHLLLRPPSQLIFLDVMIPTDHRLFTRNLIFRPVA